MGEGWVHGGGGGGGKFSHLLTEITLPTPGFTLYVYPYLFDLCVGMHSKQW